jgi:hypothetical protein
MKKEIYFSQIAQIYTDQIHAKKQNTKEKPAVIIFGLNYL